MRKSSIQFKWKKWMRGELPWGCRCGHGMSCNWPRWSRLTRSGVRARLFPRWCCGWNVCGRWLGRETSCCPLWMRPRPPRAVIWRRFAISFVLCRIKSEAKDADLFQGYLHHRHHSWTRSSCSTKSAIGRRWMCASLWERFVVLGINSSPCSASSKINFHSKNKTN